MDEGGSKSSQIFCLAWVKKGVAKLSPDQILLNPDDLKSIIAKEPADDDGEDAWDDVEDFDQDPSSLDDKEEKLSTIKSAADDDLEEYDMDNYDEEEGDFSGVGGLIMYADNVEDPYITKKRKLEKESSDSEAEEESSTHLRPDDNLLVCARCGQHSSVLEVYVYNHDSGDFYVHHDIPLMETPLCMQWLGFDPGAVNSDYRGNLLAVGNFNATIDIWDLDVLNTLEPVSSIGLTVKKQSKKRKNVLFSHTDAILDLAWTVNAKDLLASASADSVVALWDLEFGKQTCVFRDHKSKVQTVEWRPKSSSNLVSGAFDGRVILLDKDKSEGVMHWSLDGEIERLVWHPDNDNFFAASTDSGLVYYIDCRKPKSFLRRWQAHETAIPGLVITTKEEHCMLYTASSDGFVKLWDISTEEPSLVHEKNAKIGMVHCCGANPDVQEVLACGGQKDSIKLWDVTKTADIAKFVGVASDVAHEGPDTLDPLGGGGDNDDDVVKYIEGEDYINHERLDKLSRGSNPKSKKKRKKKKKNVAKEMGDTLPQVPETKPVPGSEKNTKKRRRRRKPKVSTVSVPNGDAP